MSLTISKLLLNPSQEAEAAVAGLDQITNLMLVYKWKEKSFFEIEDFKDLATRLYTAILEYQALLLDHIHRNPVKKWAKDVFGAGEWAKRLEAINQHDAHCRDVTATIEATRTREWRHEERLWYDKLLQELCQDGVEERRNIQSLYSNYEADKNVNPEKILGTCEWFLSHPSFVLWRESQSSSLLLVTADPGCGKSVLAKFLVDRKGASLTAMKNPPTVCYFFFKDEDPKRMNSAHAVCALLHQLIMQHPQLYRHAREDFRNKNETFLSDFKTVWNIFLKAIEDLLNMEVICVLDALDECSANSRDILTTHLEELYGHYRLRTTSRCTLKFLITSRPDFNVLRSFKTTTNLSFEVRLRGEEESEQISREIDLVIHHRVHEIGVKMDLSASEESDLKNNLLKITHRTYLWLYLTLDSIIKKLDVDGNDIAMIAKTIPATVDEAYTAILNKSPDQAKARRLLHIVLAARRPLTLAETNVALVMNQECTSYSDLRIWPSRTQEERIKNICGLFLIVVDSKVYLIHQTAREFLTRIEHTNTCCGQPTPTTWKNTYCFQRSDSILAQICIYYLDLQEFKHGPRRFGDQSRLTSTKDDDDDDDMSSQHVNIFQYKKTFVFLTYAAEQWAYHFARAGHVPDHGLVEKVALETSNSTRPSFKIWHEIFRNAFRSMHDRPPGLVIESYFGHDRVVEYLLARTDVQVNARGQYGRTALIGAASIGHEAVIKLLLDHKEVEVNAQDEEGNTALIRAAEEDHDTIVKHLLAHKDVKVNTQDQYGDTALVRAAVYGHENIVKLLLAHKDTQVNTQGRDGCTVLTWAVREHQEAIVKLLLAHKDVKVNIQDEHGHTVLVRAVYSGHESVVKLLLAHKDVKVNAQNKNGDTALMKAAYHGRESIVKLLLAHKEVKINTRDRWGGTALIDAAYHGHESIIKLLLAHKEVKINTQDLLGETALIFAAQRGHESIVRLLLAEGAQPNLCDMEGCTPLSYAARLGDEKVVRLLLINGVQTDRKDENGDDPYSVAMREGHVQVAQLIEAYARPRIKNEEEEVSELEDNDSLECRPGTSSSTCSDPLHLHFVEAPQTRRVKDQISDGPTTSTERAPKNS